MVVGRPDWLGVDYLVYELAAEAALRGAPFYNVTPAGFSFSYVYPPITVLLFVPFALPPGWLAGFAAFTVTELAACAVFAWAVDRLVMGAEIGLADLDRLLIGLFAAGMEPSGARDPFALRRTTIGLIEILVTHERSFDLRRGLALAAQGLPIEASQEHLDACLEFVRRRQQSLLLGAGHRHDVVEAVLAEQASDPARAARAVAELEQWLERDAWPELLENFARCARITRDLEQELELDAKALSEPAALALYGVYQESAGRERAPGSVDDFMGAFIPLVPAIQQFFEDVLVMADDQKVRSNRLALLQRIVNLSDGVADFSHMEGF
jgi:glycyl-tRNA synthetase